MGDTGAWISWGYKICLNSIGNFTRGDLCFSYEAPRGVYHVSIEAQRTYSTIDRKSLEKCFAHLTDLIGIDLYCETTRRILFFKPKLKVDRYIFSLTEFDKVDSQRIKSEVLLYLVEIKDKELLLQFSTDIKYTLDTLIELYKQRDELDYGLEIDKASKLFKEINKYCMPMQEKANEGISRIKNEKLRDILAVHNLNQKSALSKLRELNQYK